MFQGLLDFVSSVPERDGSNKTLGDHNTSKSHNFMVKAMGHNVKWV